MDKQKFQQIIHSHHRTVFHYILSLVGNHHVAEDLTQETFVVVYRKYPGEGKIENMNAWLCKIAKIKVWEEYRRLNNRPVCLTEEVADSLAALCSSGQTESREGRQVNALRHCLKKLSPRLRKIIAWRYSEQEPIQTIAEKLRKTETNVYQILSRIRGKLAACIRKEVDTNVT